MPVQSASGISQSRYNTFPCPALLYEADIQREDVVKFFPVLEEKGKQKENDYLLSISHSKWGIRGMVSVFNNAVNNEDISFEGMEKMANTMGIRFI